MYIHIYIYICIVFPSEVCGGETSKSLMRWTAAILATHLRPLCSVQASGLVGYPLWTYQKPSAAGWLLWGPAGGSWVESKPLHPRSLLRGFGCVSP